MASQSVFHLLSLYYVITFISQNIVKESEEILESVKRVEFDVNNTATSVSTTRNTLQALSDTQFIENKIEEVGGLETLKVCFI